MKSDIILRVIAKLLMPFMLIFALYVQFHGDFGPGGGFQAGVNRSPKCIPSIANCASHRVWCSWACVARKSPSAPI